MHRHKTTAGGPTPLPSPPWFAGMAIGLTILGMASSAMALGAGLAIGQATYGGK
jgi:hypothetical protein